MDKIVREKIRKSLGEGKLYEVRLSGGVVCIFTKECDFEVMWTLYYFWGDVTDRMESPVIRKIHSIFNCEVKILGYCHYCSHFSPEDVVFRDMGKESGVKDTDCTYIVCTPNRKSKITKWNIQDDSVEII